MDYEQILIDSGYSTLSARDHKDALKKALDETLSKKREEPIKEKKIKETKIELKDIKEVVINESELGGYKP